jgi:RHS repeat-associated protein
VTNLRLPGQYDERLLGSVGLQGPYYNWNRWYLPGVGRYLELDPMALTGRFNAPFRPDWYNYANANPIRFVDPTGLLVELYCESLSTAQYGLGGLGAHCFLRVACENCNQSYDRTLELFGPNQSPQYGRPMNQPFDPSFNGRGTTRRRGLSGPGMPGQCGTERCLLNSFQTQPLPPYNGLGPNSNTFAAAMLGECGLVGDFPWTAGGSGN